MRTTSNKLSVFFQLQKLHYWVLIAGMGRFLEGAIVHGAAIEHLRIYSTRRAGIYAENDNWLNQSLDIPTHLILNIIRAYIEIGKCERNYNL